MDVFNPQFRRRKFLLASSALGGIAIAGSRVHAGDQGSAGKDEEFTAAEALQELMAGNRRFVGGKSKHPRMTEDWLKRLTQGQKPLATILACSDSRVPLELLFDQGFGDLFTIRVAGNVVTRYGIGSMEYAQHHLHTPLFMVLGHEGCGAVTAAMLPKQQRKREPKGIRELLDLVHLGKLDPAVGAKSQLASAVEANVRHSAKTLMNLDPSAEGFRIHEGDMLVSAVYELKTGRVRVLETHWETSNGRSAEKDR